MAKLPVIELKINEAMDSYVSAIALVENPAIESDFIAFNQNQVNENFTVNDEKFELLGAAMIPDKPIYRNSDSGGYYAVFSKDTIRKIAQIYMKRGFQNATNIEHSSTPANSYIFQSMILDDKIAPPTGLEKLPVGTWVVGVKIDSPEVWAAIKKGTIAGFSVEGLFSLFPTEAVSDGKSAIDETELSKAINEFNAAVERLLNN